MAKTKEKTHKTIGLQYRMDEALDIEKRAESMGISCALYCKMIIRAHIKSGKKLQLKES